MPTHSLKTRVLFLCLGLFLAGAALLWAGGQAEPRLAEAERLIQEKDYSAALKLLATIQRENPELRDKTSRMMAEIRAVMNQYNGVLSELSQARAKGDVDSMERLLPQLSKIDPSRSGEVVKASSTLASFLRLMDDAAAPLSAGKPAEAIGFYLQSLAGAPDAVFTLSKRDLESAGYSSILTASAEETVAALAATATAERRAERDIEGARASVKALLAGKATAATLGAFDDAVAPLRDAALAEGAARKYTETLASLSRTIRDTEGNGKLDPYFQYVQWISLGRSKRNEGLCYALHEIWADSARKIGNDVAASANLAFVDARKRFDAGVLDEAAAGFDDAYYRSVTAVKAAALAGATFTASPATGWAFTGPDRDLAVSLLSSVATAQEQAGEVGAYRAMIDERKTYAGLPTLAAVAAKSEVPGLTSARTSIAALADAADALRAEWTLRSSAWGDTVGHGYAPREVALSAQGVADRFARFIASDLRERDIAYALRLDQIGALDFPSRLADARALASRGEDERDGTQGGKPPSQQAGIAVRHPENAVISFRAAAATLDSLVSDIEAHETRIRSDTPYVTASPSFAALFSGSGAGPGLDELLASAQQARVQCEQLIAGAQGQIDQAAVFSREGDNWFAQAVGAVNRNDPDGADSFLEKATESYVKSLASQYTDHAASRTGKESDDLTARILNLRNSLAIQSAQKSIAAISKLVSARDFLAASVALDAAQAVWNQTQEGSYPPFDNLRQNIQNALDLSQGRDISRLDPKADVVNAFIGNAQDNLAAGRLVDADRNVKDALTVAPNYGAAKVLQLMIKKRTDPAGFQKDAQAQISQYVEMARDSGNPGGQKTAYLALLDYSRLDPKLAAQLKGTIQELEYALGLARRPATPQQIRQSDDLVARADSVQRAGTTDSYQEALGLLKQALQINPDNTAAVRLDGQIRTKIGSTALTALPTGASQRYNEALSLYLSGAYQDSYGIVLDLWNDARSPRNKTYGPLQKLKKRLEVALNIS